MTESIPNVRSKVPVLVVDSRPPFPELALYALDTVPRPGDFITVVINTNHVSYKVDFVNINPFGDRNQVAIGCSFAPAAPTNPDSNAAPTDIKDRMDQLVRGQIQVFEKAQSYSNAMILGGYAGIFALWTFSKGVLAAKATNTIVVLVGISLILYVSWEVVSMIHRAIVAANFVKLIDKSPTDFFQLLTIQDTNNRRIIRRALIFWRAIVVPTILTAYLAAALLIYNAAAGIFGLSQWPH